MVMDEVILRGASQSGAGRGPTILERTDQEFIPAVLDELGAPEGLNKVLRTLARTKDRTGTLKLYQPVHRTFHVALMEIVCDTFGEPRLDAQKIESAGLVLRRLRTDARGGRVVQAWRRAGQTLQGWMSFRHPSEMNDDPEAARRPPALRAGNPEINRRLALVNVSPSFDETTSPLFIAPPEVCSSLKRTVLYGLIPLTSTDQSETPTSHPPFDKAMLRAHVPRFLRRGGPRPVTTPKATVTYADVTNPDLAAQDAGLAEFVDNLRQLAIEFEAFGETTAAQNLFRELNKLRLRFSSGATKPAGDFLKDAARKLIEGVGSNASTQPKVTMPVEWPVVSENQAEKLVELVQGAMRARLDQIAPREGRFDDAQAQYVVRAFARVKRDDGCPPRTVWSDYSQPFTVAQWFEASNAVPPVRVNLPNPFDGNFLNNVKPNVAFSVPKDLFNLMQGIKLKDIMDGKKPAGGGIELDWICGFNIPIITLCAFIVLNIFLSLFDLFLMWMIKIKICIPVPK